MAKLQGQLNSEREEMRTKEATEAEKNIQNETSISFIKIARNSEEFEIW